VAENSVPNRYRQKTDRLMLQGVRALMRRNTAMRHWGMISAEATAMSSLALWSGRQSPSADSSKEWMCATSSRGQERLAYNDVP